MSFKDHFSGHASNYAKFRPNYPNSLYEQIYCHVSEFDLAWDCATGNGQVALELAKQFKRVVATDASAQQIENAFPDDKVEYAVAPAEETNFADGIVDLVTVGQALHWFNFKQFFDEVERVLKSDGLFVCWTYKYLEITPELDTVLKKFYAVIEKYWPPERMFVHEEYQTIPFPEHFKEIELENGYIEREVYASDALNYLRTWSAVKNYKKQHNNEDPLLLIESEFNEVWGDLNQTKILKHPMFIRAFKLK